MVQHTPPAPLLLAVLALLVQLSGSGAQVELSEGAAQDRECRPAGMRGHTSGHGGAGACGALQPAARAEPQALPPAVAALLALKDAIVDFGSSKVKNWKEEGEPPAGCAGAAESAGH